MLQGLIALRFRALVTLSILALLMAGCGGDRGSYTAANQADCLPAITLTDQFGQPLTLSTLRGKPVLVDFIYTQCPGPCLLLTQKMAAVARRLGPAVGSKIALLSIDIDPEHDSPDQLAEYIKRQDAEANGWHFVTGSPAEIDQLLRKFQLAREREKDGSVAHVAGIFLLGPDGKEVREYDGKIVKVSLLADEVEQMVATSPVRG